MKKCRYCVKELDSNLEFCSTECENSYRKIDIKLNILFGVLF